MQVSSSSLIDGFPYGNTVRGGPLGYPEIGGPQSNPGLIAGIFFGVLAVLGVAAGLVFWMRKKAANAPDNSPDAQLAKGADPIDNTAVGIPVMPAGKADVETGNPASQGENCGIYSPWAFQ
jgi:hypothetical protein